MINDLRREKGVAFPRFLRNQPLQHRFERHLPSSYFLSVKNISESPGNLRLSVSDSGFRHEHKLGIDHGMTESERCCRELIEDGGVDARIIVRVFCDAQTILVHVFFSEYRGQILSIDNVLDFGY